MARHIDSGNRLHYIDIARGIGILLVVFGHNALCIADSQTAAFIYSFHMPLFFFLAGLFHNESRSYLSHIGLKAQSLLLPCVLAFAIFITIQAVFIPDLLFPILSDLSVNALYGTGRTMFWGQLWFLTSLFLTSCLCHPFVRLPILMNRIHRASTALVLGSAGILLLEFVPPLHSIFIGERNFIVSEVGLPWNIDLLHITVAFYLLGTAFPKEALRNHKAKAGHVSIFAASAFVFVSGGVLLMDWTMDLNKREYSHWAGSTFVAICGISGVLLTSLAIEKLPHRWASRALAFVGKRSFFILVLHFSIQQNSFGKMLSAGVPWLVAAIISFAVGLGVSLAVALLWTRLRKSRMLGKKNPA